MGGIMTAETSGYSGSGTGAFTNKTGGGLLDNQLFQIGDIFIDNF